MYCIIFSGLIAISLPILIKPYINNIIQISNSVKIDSTLEKSCLIIIKMRFFINDIISE